MARRTLGLLGAGLLVAGLWLVVDHELGHTGPQVRVNSRGVPQAAAERVAGAPVGSSIPPAPRDRSGIPVRVEIPFPSRNHPQGVVAEVSADHLLPSGALSIPADPRRVSWAEDDAAPGAPRGTAILSGHIDYGGVEGAFSDLAEYVTADVGRTFTLVLADGRELSYRIVGGAEYRKDQLAAHPDLRQQIFDQTGSFGPAPGSGRLVLVSCGGAFDNRTGNYEDNVFVFAMPAS